MKILLIDDDDISRRSIANFLKDPLNYSVTEVNNCGQALELYINGDYDVVISDIRMPGMNGIDLLRAIKALPNSKNTDVIMITGFGELETSITALREGATDYLLKPINIKELAHTLSRIKEHKRLKQENEKLNEHFDEEIEKTTKDMRDRLQKLEIIYSDLMEQDIGIFSPEMNEMVKLCNVFHAHRDIPVLIEGETGTGKEIIAHLIHSGGKKNIAPFISLNCSAISASLFESELFGYVKGAFTGASDEGALGKIELANGGTLFLDEIGDMPIELQPKLLRVLQEKTIYRVGGKQPVKLDVRFVFATNQNLLQQVEKGLFRKDLLYRINTGHLVVPPLRDRKAEIIPLAKMFLSQCAKLRNKKFTRISSAASTVLQNYPWPGNIRELKSVIERAVLLFDAEELTPVQLNIHQGILPVEEGISSQNQCSFAFTEQTLSIDDIEHQIAHAVLQKFDGNISQAARYLQVSWRRFKRMAGIF